MKSICPNCGSEYSRLGAHWASSKDCYYPEISDEVMDILTGILMGDGNLDYHRTNARFKIGMTNQEYLKHLDNKFDWLSTGVKLERTAEEAAKLARDNGFSPDAKAENYQDFYLLQTRSHPTLNEFRDWYQDGKTWKNVDMNPTIFTHWYVCDGSIDDSGTSKRISISAVNESGNEEKIESMLSELGVSVSNWRGDGNTHRSLRFNKEDSKKLWSMMEVQPGFEYKFPSQDQ